MATKNKAQVMDRNLRWASDAANARVHDHEISTMQAQVMVSHYAADLTKDIDIAKIPPADAWIYGNIYLTAQDWKDAKTVLTSAVLHAKDEDRRVNDSLRLAEVYANLGQVPKAVELCRSTFNAAATGKAPILPAVMFRVVPAARGKGHDLELASLLEDAIRQHEEVVVDPKLTPGKLFLLAKPTHIRTAWGLAIELYESSGHQDLAQKAAKMQTQDSSEPKAA